MDVSSRDDVSELSVYHSLIQFINYVLLLSVPGQVSRNTPRSIRQYRSYSYTCLLQGNGLGRTAKETH